MNLKNRNHVLLVVSILIISCSSSKEDTALPIIQISENDIVDFDEAIASIEFIPLKNQMDSPKNLNCSVWDLKVTENYFIYSTICNPEAKIHFFDLEGNYVKTFDKSDDGPEEYQAIQGINIEQDTINITVGGGIIKQYRFADFGFIGMVSLDEETAFIPSFTKISKTKWMTSPMFDGKVDQNGEFSIFKIMDSSNKQITDLPIKTTPLTAEISEGEFAKLGQSYLLNYAFSDTLYLFENGKTSPFVGLDFGERKPSSEDLKMNAQGFETTIMNQSFAFNVGKIWHTDNTSRLKTFALAKNPNMDISNMRTFPVHEVFVGHKTNNVIAFPSLVGWSNGKGFAKDGYFYDILRADDWINSLETKSLGKHEKKLEEILEKLDGFEDPILVKYKVKIPD